MGSNWMQSTRMSGAGVAVLLLLLAALPAQAGVIVGADVFYNNSVWDGNDPAGNAADESAIAPDKTALLPGMTSTFANYTSYDKGLNGIMFDILGAPGVLSSADLAFRAGNDTNPAGWASATTPSSIVMRAGAGVGGSDRYHLIWPDSTIVNQWLQVSVLSTANTGLATDYVFYFGNLVGDVNGNGSVTPIDLATIIAAQSSGPYATTVADPLDLDRNGWVSAGDALIVQSILNAGGSQSLATLTAPVGTTDPIPEPATFVGVGLGLGAIAWVVRRRRMRH